MKEDKTPEKVNNRRLGPDEIDQFPDWTLTPADVDIDAMLEEARKQMEESGETLEEFIHRTMGISLDDYIDMTLAGGQGRTIQIPADAVREGEAGATREVPIEATQQVSLDKTQQVSLDKTQQVSLDKTQQVSLDKTQQVSLDKTQQVSLDKTQQVEIGSTQAVSPKETRVFAASDLSGETRTFREGMTGTRVFEPFEEDDSLDADEKSSMTRTRVVTEPIDWKQAEEEEAGYKGNDGRKRYGLSDEDVKDTISMSKPDGVQEPVDEIEKINKRIDKRKRDSEKRQMRNRLRIKIALIALVSGIFLFVFSLSSFFTVDAIEVRGNKHYSAEEIINIAHAVPGKNLIYNTGSKEIIEYLEQNPYIKEAIVARKLPSTLVISVTERKQACSFKYDDDFLVMDDEGILLRKTRTQPKITQVSGLVVSKMKLGEVVGTKDRKLFNKMLDLIRTTNDADMYFVKIDMAPAKDDPDLVKAYIYDTFIVKGKYDLLMKNLQNGRLHRVIEELFSQSIKRGTITFTEEGTISFEPGL